MAKSKFFLKSLKKNGLRFEVIYKNILRDMRKFYTFQFTDCVDYLTNKKVGNNMHYCEGLRTFVNSSPLFANAE